MQNTLHTTQISMNTFPFTKLQLKKFKRELEESGGFFRLMQKKEAIIVRNGIQYIATYENVELYKKRYLTGIYESLRPMYDTEIPFAFWSDLYEMLIKLNPPIQ